MLMNNKLKLLKGRDYFKAFLPVILLLFVFFLQPVLSSFITEKLQGQLTMITNSLDTDIDQGDRDFIKALLAETDNFKLNNLELSQLNDNRFLTTFYTPGKAAVEENTAETAEVAPQQEIIYIPNYVVSSVFNGKDKKFAVLYGLIARIGTRLPTGDRVTAIKDRAVQIEGQWGKKWFYVHY